jgi:hypothetical protein
MANRTKGRNKDHDIFIRGILSLDELVLLLLHRYIPAKLQPYIDFPSLKKLSDVHITNKLLAKYSDSIHECALRKEHLPEHIRNNPDLPTLRFCFLWEAKSHKPYSYIEAQIEPYRYAIVDLDKKNKNHPSIVIPILLYHGATTWDKKMLHDQFIDILPPEILEYIPNPKYIVIDVQAIKEEEIERMVDLGVLRAAFVTLKNAHKKNFFKQDMGKALKFVEDLPVEYVFQEFFKMLLEYMQRRSGLETEEFDEIVEQNLNSDMAATIKTIFEVAEERAELRGELRGTQKGTLQKARLTVLRGKFRGATTDFLADVSELSYDEVENLLKGYNQVYDMWQTKDFENKVIDYLSIDEVNYLLELFDKI